MDRSDESASSRPERAALPVAGYSGTPLAGKLGIKRGSRVYLSAAPEDYLQLLSPVPEEVQFVGHIGPDTDVIHAFATERAALEAVLPDALGAMGPSAVIWVSWPKKASKVPTDVTEDVVREVALPLGLVDVKVCAVDDVWSGLKLVLRLENRGTRA